MKTAVFADGNFLLHRAYHAFGERTSVPEKKIPLALLDYCCTFALEKGAQYGAIAFDGPENFRYDVYRDYKSNRGGGGSGEGEEGTNDAMYALLPHVCRLFQMVGFPYVQKPQFEADDLVVAGATAFTTEDDTSFAWVCGRDKDSLQYVSKRIGVFWPKVGDQPSVSFTPEEVVRHKGMLPGEFGDYQILVGDAMDCIPGIIKPAAAKKILKEHGRLRKFFRTEEGGKFFRANEPELTRNLKLVRMDLNSWIPSQAQVKLKLKESSLAFREFGKLPASFGALRSSSGRKTLFG